MSEELFDESEPKYPQRAIESIPSSEEMMKCVYAGPTPGPSLRELSPSDARMAGVYAGPVMMNERTSFKNRFCRECGSLIPENGKFCPQCGTKVLYTKPDEGSYV